MRKATGMLALALAGLVMMGGGCGRGADPERVAPAPAAVAPPDPSVSPSGPSAPASGPALAPSDAPAADGTPGGAGSGSSANPPNGVDLLFARMMIPHHAQAVRMSRNLLTKSGVSPRVVAIAEFIARDQQREIDEMNAWLESWDQPRVDPADPAAARVHTREGHGMLTEAQLAELASAQGPAADRLYLTRMIEHHLGAIAMAKGAVSAGRNAYVRNLAKHVVNEQGAENEAMRRLIDA
ncbi:DUF305 domain-containing protein [Plantactinospora endophytica]|uniref:DUF305 domain-containing protein n=1 Tax=Plantactinospora endophytica TaxID=673535 RepID=A0ABQ4E7D7_9ACTN|nr:DUF305 domain-containing protein [Plantactinospora endophytica]GIG90639.1 hypothetical protein Pen02_55750 [Plantactinospora endophytica]